MADFYEKSTEIQKIYQGTHIFVTGATGFLGCLLVEKLLRSCPGLEKLYLLMKDKKGQTAEERLIKLFESPIYDKLKTMQTSFYKKITIINGDCEAKNIGLKPDDINILQANVDIVFHLAATVRFDEAFKKASYINVRCVRDLMEIASNMKKLKAFVHVSTAYSNCTRKEIDELFYDAPMTCNKLLQICDMLNDEQLTMLQPKLIDKCPNTYIFTKVIAENVIKEYAKNIPIAIVRPSIIVSTYKEPISGWINNFYGVIGLAVGSGKGLLHCLYCDKSNLADMVPADYVVNLLIATAWQVTAIGLFDDIKKDENTSIYNYVCSVQNPIIWEESLDIGKRVNAKMPLMNSIMPVYLFMIPNRFLHFLFTILTHYIPGLFLDSILTLIGKKPKLFKLYKKIHKLSDLCGYFAMNEWHFHNDNIQTLWHKMSITDRELFEFDLSALDWNTHIFQAAKGGKQYLLNESISPESIQVAKRQQLMVKVIFYLLIIFGIYIFYKLLSFLLYFYTIIF